MKQNGLRALLKVTLALLISGAGAVVRAEKMDLETHNAVIEQLSNVVKDLDRNDPSKVPSTLRLADLLAERSRLKSLKEVEKNCENCLKSIEDRRQALRHYTEVVPLLTGRTRSQAMLQKAHLHFSLGESAATEKIYTQMTKEGPKHHEADILGQAYAALGDVYFQKTEFKKAKVSYEHALAIQQTPQKGIVHFRLAWCQFNLDQVRQAIGRMEMILQTPKLTEITSPDGTVAQDETFKIDLAKDLAAFYARAKITRDTINKLMVLSPASEQQNNLFYLGKEADRLGKKKESALVWMVYLERHNKDKDALEAQISLMKLKRDMGQVTAALQVFKHVAELWVKPGCGEKCADYQDQIHKWITNWNREEKKEKTKELTLAYMTYSQIFPDDEEMFLRGAEVAKQRSQYRQAFELFRKAADVSYKKKAAVILEGALIGEIDMAETLKNHELRLMAYKHYLSLNPKGAKEFDVRYQMAQTEFEKKNFEGAATQFRSLALEDNKNAKGLQKTAAHMSIEALIKIKREDAIEAWSADYMKHFPKAEKEFAAIYRKAVLNVTAIRINQRKADQSDLNKLNTMPLVGSTIQERISLFKNRYLLAVRLENFAEAKRANQELLSVKELSSNDSKEAWQNRIWLAELELDFKVAYHLAEAHTVKMTADHAMRLIWLAQMAGMNPEKHENDFLRLSGNRGLRATVITARLQRQKHPEREMKQFIKELSKSPETLARLSLEIYSKTGQRTILQSAYDFPSVRRTSTGSIIGRLLVYKELNGHIQRLATSRLNTRSDKNLKKSLEERLSLIKVLEKNGQMAINAKDVVLQAIILDVLRNENLRLHDDILRLPLPRGLNAQQKVQYQALVAQQAAPYKFKASQIETKMQRLWSPGNWSSDLANNYVAARIEYKPALRQDLIQLQAHAPISVRENLKQALNEPSRIPNENAVAKVRQQVKQTPFKEAPVAELKDLESRRGNDLVVAHLEARLNLMKRSLK